MAVSETRTLLPLDTFARIMGIHPVHFNGVFVPGVAEVVTCGQPLAQFAWQTSNAVSREDIAQAIADAEERIAGYTRFKLLPTFEVDERHQWPSSAWLWDSPAVKTDWAHVVAAGIQGLTLLGAGAPIVYTDTDGDGYSETATITLSTTITDAGEIMVVYPGENGDRAWEVRPCTVTLSGGVATIRVRREQLVNPGLLSGFNTRAVDGTDDSQFLTTVDVYRSWHNPEQQIQFLWENAPSLCGCSDAVCTTCTLAAQFGCATVRDYRTGMMSASAATWDSTAGSYTIGRWAIGRPADRARLWYRAGFRDQTQKRPMLDMKPQYARAVAYMATALLARPMCQCQNVTAQVEYWQDDLSAIKVGQSASENFQLDRRLLSNPFGTTRGAIYAWRTFQQLAVGEAALI